MKTKGIIGYVSDGDVLEIDIRTHMAIEFTKSLLSNSNLNTEEQYATNQIYETITIMGISYADELIKQLKETS